MSMTFVEVPINASSPLLTEDMLFGLSAEPDRNESTCRKICRVSVAVIGVGISYLSLVPAVLTANSFNPFPGAGEISAAAVIVSFGTFGAYNYLDLSNILFKRFSIGKNLKFCSAFKIILSLLLGIGSRLPAAGVALKIAPGIPSEWRMPLAIFGVLGTLSPEVVSTFNSLTDLQEQCECNEDNFPELRTALSALKHRLFQLPKEERNLLLDHLEALLLDFPRPDQIQQFFDEIIHCNDEIICEDRTSLHKFVNIVGGVSTSFGTVCALIQNAILTKIAFDFVIPEHNKWKWIASGICALTIAHTAFKVSYLGIRQCFQIVQFAKICV